MFILKRVWDDIRKFWWVVFIFLGYIIILQTFFTATCPVFQTIGLPCAGCGMSRAIRFVLTGQFSRAYYLNPLAFLIVLFIMYCFFFRYVLGKIVPYFVPGIVIIFVLMIVFYVVRMYLYFPDRVPYVYNYSNRMEDYLPGYRGFVRKLLRF